MRWDCPPLDINPLFPGLGGFIIIIIVIIIIIIIYLFRLTKKLFWPQNPNIGSAPRMKYRQPQ